MATFNFEKPNFNGNTVEEKVEQIEKYLFRLAEELDHLPVKIIEEGDNNNG